MAKDKVSLPSGQGGLVRYDENLSSFSLEPGHVVIATAVIAVIFILLNLLG